MIITTNTGANSDNDSHSFCKCGTDYGGDRIVVEDNSFVPILDGDRGCGLDLSGFFKNVSQVNTIKFKLNQGQTKTLTSPDGNTIKFLAIVADKPTSILYWRKIYNQAFKDFTSIILNGSYRIVTMPFTSDRINSTFELTLDSDNAFKLISWSNLSAAFVNGEYVNSWANASLSWNEYDPLITTNHELVIEDKIISIPFVIEQDDNGNFTGEIVETIQIGSSAIDFKLKFHGEYPNTFIIDELTLELDGHLVGSLYIDQTAPTVDFITTPLCMDVNGSFLASSGQIEVYDKIVGMMVLTSTDNESIADIKLLNNGPNQIKVQAMIGT